MTLFTLKLGLVIFWMLWQLIVFLTNLFEGLKLLRIVPPYWKFASQNYQSVEQATGAYQRPFMGPEAPLPRRAGLATCDTHTLCARHRLNRESWVISI